MDILKLKYIFIYFFRLSVNPLITKHNFYFPVLAISQHFSFNLK